MAKIRPIEVRLALMNFLEFAVWGAYLISLGNFLARNGLQEQIGWFYTVQGIVSLFMPAVIGIMADRWIQAQRMLSVCHLLAGCFMAAAGIYCLTSSQIEFGPLFTLYTLSRLFHADNRTREFCSVQRAQQSRPRHHQTFPANTCIRYSRLYLLDAVCQLHTIPDKRLAIGHLCGPQFYSCLIFSITTGMSSKER